MRLTCVSPAVSSAVIMCFLSYLLLQSSSSSAYSPIMNFVYIFTPVCLEKLEKITLLQSDSQALSLL